MDAIFLKAIGILVALVLFYTFWRFLTNSHGEVNGRRIEAPKPKGAWPIIGHIPLLGGQNPVFRTLAAMADKHGPVFRIPLGVHQALVVSSKEAVLKCFTINDHVFMTRLNSVALKYMGYNGALFGLAPYGLFWREMRKISSHEVLSKRRPELLKDVRASEVTRCIKELHLLCCKNWTVGSAKFDMAQWLHQVTINIMIARKRYCSVGDGGNDPELRRFRKAMKVLGYSDFGLRTQSKSPNTFQFSEQS